MPKRIALSLFLIASAIGPAAAQDNNDRGGIRTETMDRKAAGQSGMGLLWNLVGTVGLLGLLGLRKEHAEDSYHPASLE